MKIYPSTANVWEEPPYTNSDMVQKPYEFSKFPLDIEEQFYTNAPGLVVTH